MIWGIFAVILLIALFLLGWPLFKSGGPALSRTERGLDVYRRQLTEIDAEIERGALAPAEAEPMQLEIKRRMLRLGREEGPAKPLGGNGRLALIALLVIVPVVSLALYADLGSPNEPARPLAARDIPAERAMLAQNNAATLIKRLIAQLREHPDNIEGWVLLAQTLTKMDRFEQAAQTYEKATLIAPKSAALYVGAGENYYFAAKGKVDGKSAAAFEKALALEPENPGARYYLALRDFEAGKAEQALQSWQKLYEDSPAEAPYLAVLSQRIEEAAKKTGTELGDFLTRKKLPGPSEEDVAAASKLSGGDRQAMIKSMVEGLAARMGETPDYDGLMRLGQSYGVLKEFDKSADAYSRALDQKPGDKAAMAGAAGAYIQASDINADPPEKAIALYREILKKDPDYAEALWYVGLKEAAAGNRDAALQYWRKLQAKAPEGSTLKRAVDAAIKELSAPSKN
ncbi:MAG: c-type cytochrome biogenesis protein CcmI [Alphaproteobacteria bacterium]|nr:MAG: c-type cytochrome biogenesis protein CcmI [Alphaproteobacteria bacterium]